MIDEHSGIRHLKHRWDEEDKTRDELERQAKRAFLEQEANELFAPLENYLASLDKVLHVAKGIRRQLMKATMLVQISISTFFVFCLLTASANALDATDATRLDNLVRKSLQLEQDILSVRRGSPLGGQEWECLNELYYKLEVISVRIEWLYSMELLVSSMNDKSDKQTVLDLLNEDATNFLNHVEISRKGINSTAGYCSSINVAVAKAQEILGFYDEATSDVRSIMNAR
jgi:hypothetical protein